MPTYPLAKPLRLLPPPRRYLPILRGYPAKYIYDPWNAPESVQKAAKCIIGVHYPKPMVHHAEASRLNIERMKQIYQQLSCYRGLGESLTTGTSHSKRALKAQFTSEYTLCNYHSFFSNNQASQFNPQSFSCLFLCTKQASNTSMKKKAAVLYSVGEASAVPPAGRQLEMRFSSAVQRNSGSSVDYLGQ